MATALTTPLLTLEQFESLPDDDQRHELDAGALISMPPVKSRHSDVALNVYDALAPFVRQHRLRKMFIECGYLLVHDPPTVRGPDVSFLAASRTSELDRDEYFRGGPTLAVEVVSPSDRAGDLARKTKEFLDAGAAAVWVAYPKTETVHVNKPGTEAVVLEATDVLADDSLFPGWSVAVAQIFKAG